MQKIIAKIDTASLQSNAVAFKKMSGAKLCAVIKADAYGHGAIGVAQALYGIADYFAVALLEEALAVKTVAVGKEIWILTPPADEETAYLAAANGFVLCVSDEASARLVCETANFYKTQIKVHLKVDTGMNRYGMGLSALGRVCKRLQGNPRISVLGIYSHLHAHTRAGAERQRSRFERAIAVCKRYFPCVLPHLAATYGATLGRDFSYGAVRIGLGLYGYLPSGEYGEKPKLRPVMKLYAPCVSNRGKSYGGVGYADEERTVKQSSVVRIGYADGTGHSKGGYKALSGQTNDFCMDACIVEKKVNRGQWVCVMDDADEVASRRGTISYEVLCLSGIRAEKRYE